VSVSPSGYGGVEGPFATGKIESVMGIVIYMLITCCERRSAAHARRSATFRSVDWIRYNLHVIVTTLHGIVSVANVTNLIREAQKDLPCKHVDAAGSSIERHKRGDIAAEVGICSPLLSSIQKRPWILPRFAASTSTSPLASLRAIVIDYHYISSLPARSRVTLYLLLHSCT
jgi:hypothetical protein